MARSQHSRASSLAPGATRHKASLQQRKPSYKVVLEQVTEKKKRLLTHLVFSTAAPRGYTFIPAGDPQLTNRCKEVARQDGLDVFIVSATKEKHSSTLSHEVHRVGYHFPSTVVEKACTSLSVTLSSSGRVIYNQRAIPQNPIIRSKKKKKPRRRGLIAQSPSPRLEASQAEIDTEAREAISDLFPKIPLEDLNAVISLAFKKGSNLVGTADLPLHRRAQLGVLAHIRHVYTNYEQLLRIGEWKDARAAVEHQCLDKLVQWRGDDEDDTDAMSDILREVIVIPDDEEDHGPAPRSGRTPENRSRDASVEIVATRAAANAIHTQRFISPRSSDGESDTGLESDAMEDGAYRAEPTTDRRLFDRVEAHRHRAWAAARTRRRQGAQNTYGDSSPMLLDSIHGRRPQSTAYPHRYAGDNPDSSISDQNFQAPRIPFASAVGSAHSPSTFRRSNPVIDLTSSPHSTSSLYSQQHTRYIPFSDRNEDVHSKANHPVTSHPSTGDRVTNATENVNLMSNKSYQIRPSEVKFPAEQILPSIERPFQAMEVRNPFPERSSGNNHSNSQSVPRNGGEYDWISPIASVTASSEPDKGRKRRIETEGDFHSSYSQNKPTPGTVLIPLHEYSGRNGTEAKVLSTEYGRDIFAFGAQEQYGHRALAREHLDMDDSGVALDYSRRIRSPQGPTQGPSGQYQRPPHLQIQLKPGARAFPTTSPIPLESSHSDSHAFPKIPNDQSSFYEAPSHAVLTHNDDVYLENRRMRPTSVRDKEFDRPTVVGKLPDRPQLLEMTGYTHDSGSLSYNNDSRGASNSLGYSYTGSKLTPFAPVDNEQWVVDGNRKFYPSQRQHLMDSGEDIRGSSQYTQLPFRNRRVEYQDPNNGNWVNEAYSNTSSQLSIGHQEDYLSNEKESNVRNRPAARPQMLTYISYEANNDSNRTRRCRESARTLDSRREFVVID